MVQFIVFEGVDQVGKSTQLALLDEYYKQRHLSSFITREPGGSALGESLRNLLKSNTLDAEVETLLFTAARKEHVQNHIYPALSKGEVILCDRFLLSTLVYQGDLKGVSKTWIMQLHNHLINLSPTLYVLLIKKQAYAATEQDAYDILSVQHFDRMQDYYLKCVKEFNFPHVVIEVEAEELPPVIHNRVLASLQAFGLISPLKPCFPS